MDIEIVEEEENPMLHRRDVTFELIHDEATPSRLSVRDSLAARLGKSADEVVIRSLDTKFGMRRTVGTAKVYETPNHAQDIEQEYMLDRNKIGDTDGEVTNDEDEAPDVDEAEEEPEADAEEEEP
ncbi:MAG: 30S ribosomal protein S24e, partial [Halobacteriales archaeon]|nr:30S ribosomal protein S24e [Halobacteriales archaeon]